MSSNLIFTIWAVVHFLLCNFLTVLLRPSYEEPVETAKDLINRNIIPFNAPGTEMWIQFFADSPDPIYQEISRRLVIAKDWNELYGNYARKVISTGMYALIRTMPDPYFVPEEDYKDWYRSTETVAGLNIYGVDLSNKKWPLKKVLM